MRSLTILLAMLLFLGIEATFAQRTITGQVTGADDGAPIPGASVRVAGASGLGTMTDLNGNYSLQVPDEFKTLIFTFVGMQTAEVAISGSVVNVALNSEDVLVGDIVVTALGIARDKKALGYAVQEVSGDEIADVKSANFVSQLSGKVAGVQIQTNSNFGGSVNVLVRGASSITGNNQALFVVDGVPLDNSVFNTGSQQAGGRGYDYGSAAGDINPDDIASISVLKGAAATALWGSRAANGVILITTKKGSANKSLGVEVSFAGMMGVVDKSTFPEYQNEYGAGYGKYYEDPTGLFLYRDMNGDGTEDLVTPVSEDASYGAKFDPNLMVYQWNSLYEGLDTYGKATPWVAAANTPIEFFQNSYSYNTSAQVSGGNDRSTYRLAYQNQNQTGILVNSLLRKNGVTFSGSYKITDKIKFSSHANLINTNTRGRNETGYSGNIGSSFRQWWQTNVDILEQKEAYEKLGEKNTTWNPADPTDMNPIYWNNFYFQRYQNYQTDEKNRIIAYSQLDWELTDFMDVTARASIDNYNLVQEERLAVGSVAEAFGIDLSDATSGYTRRDRNFMETNFDLIANFHKDFSENFTFRGVLGSNIRKTSVYAMTSSTQGGLVVPNLYSVANSKESVLAPAEALAETQVNGYFANVSFGFMQYLFLEASVRMDQSSTLPEGNNTYLYPSVSGSFLFSELLQQDWLSLGKVRLNYAVVGNSAPFARINDVYLQGSPFNGEAMFGVPATKYNPELKPESLQSVEAGLQMAFLNNRVGFDLTLYKNNSFDQIMPVSVSAASGYTTKYINAGNMENKGIEVALNFTPVKFDKGFQWDVDINWSRNINQVIELTEGVKNLTIASLQGGVSINARVGEPYGVIQGTDYVYSDPKNPSEANRIILSSGRYMKSATSDKVIGNIQPDWMAGMRNSFSYKNLNFSFLIDWKQGGDIFSLDMWYGMATGLYPETVGNNDLGSPLRNPIVITDNTDPLNPVYADNSGGVILTGVQRVVNGVDTTYVKNNIRARTDYYANPWGYATAPNAQQIYDGTYIKLREVNITYTLPKNLFQGKYIQGVTIGLTGSNLWILHKNLPYADPESSQGAGNVQGWQSGTMPSTRNFGFNVNVKF